MSEKPNPTRTVAVCGSTGRQGGAVARRLLQRGWNVRALTRRPDGSQARALARDGAQLFQADLMDRASLDRAFAGADAVFGVTDFWEHGYKQEIAQGRALIDAARAAQVRTFIFSSVGATDRTEGLGITHFDSKQKIEAHLRASGLDWTILRPVTFLENFVSPRIRRTICKQGLFQFCFVPGKPFQMIAMEDLAVFATKALEERERFGGRALELASDRFTMEQLCAALTRAIGRPVRYRFLPPFVQRIVGAFVSLTRQQGHFKVGPSLIPQFRWNNESEVGGWDADLEALRTLHPGLMTVDAWVKTIAWREGLS